MTIAEKYSKVLILRKKKTYKAEDELGFGRNTLSNAIRDNRELSEEYHKKFIMYYGVNPDWWDTEKGEVFLKNGTYNDKAGDNNGKSVPEEVYRDLVESNSEYRLVPKVIMDDYHIVPKSHEDVTNKRIQEIIDAKNDLIKELRDEIAELKAGTRVPVPVAPPVPAQQAQ